MSRGRRLTYRSRGHTFSVQERARELVAQRQNIEDVDWTGRNTELLEHLGKTASVGMELIGLATRMDRDGSTTAARLTEFVREAGNRAIAQQVEVG